MNTKKYYVDKKAKLSDWETDDNGGLDRQEIEVKTAELQEGLADWQERLYAEGQQALLIVLQARDAGGKDSTVKHVFGAFNPNGVRVANFKVPSQLELAHDFLWRIHAQVPKKGMIGVFNRSHYEDVLVTRVHQMIDDQTAKRRLEHIQNFEQLLVDSGTRILKFYLHASKEEQKERFQERLDRPEKNWKFNMADLKEREKWDEYTEAYQDVLETSTKDAPWYVIPADRKWFRNYLISHIVLDTLKDMNPEYPEIDFDPSKIVIE